MNAPLTQPLVFHPAPAQDELARRLRDAVRGEVLFDAASRGRYSTDASIYQVEPLGVLVPRTMDDVDAALEVCRSLRVPVLPRGAGSSQCGQTVGAALVIDHSKHLNAVIAFDPDAATVTVQPGIVLDQLNAWLRDKGVWFPVDVSTSAQATIGGMAGNNSCGSRSIAYGNMVHNVHAIDATLADGTQARFGPEADMRDAVPRVREIVAALRAIAAREHEEIARRVPHVMRRVGGYNVDIFAPQSERPYTRDGSANYAHLLVGSEGTLAWSRALTLKLAALPAHRTLGVVNFPTLYRAMECAQHLVKLAPSAVELVDRTMIDLARSNPAFRPVIDAALIGEPEAILLVEFTSEERADALSRLDHLIGLMGDLGLPGAVVPMREAAPQKALWDVRKAGLNIMMSMKGDGKPVSFIEDCAVPLEHLADYVDRLTQVFAKHGTRGTWYAHASVGTLHVRPILDMRRDGAAKMRAIAEEAGAMVREYKGAFSGEHGDGLVRSEFHTLMYGPKTVRLFEEVKDRFDPHGTLNPGKIVRPSRMDDRTLFRFKPDYRVPEMAMALDWSAYPGRGGGFQGAVEMCNNNGECRKLAGGVMCPSFRITGNEADVTRGRANALRLAISGQLGPDAFASDEMLETLKLCVSCKGCRRECPTGVDMAKMKIEVLAAANRRRGLSLHDRLVAYLPRYAPYAARLAPLMNLRNQVPGLATLAERLTGFSARRALPRWRWDLFRFVGLPPTPSPSPQGGGESLRGEVGASPQAGADSLPPRGGGLGRGGTTTPLLGEVALFADTFNTYFEPENLHETIDVLTHLGYRVTPLAAAGERRPLCCGRTFLAAGLVEEARAEARRVLAVAAPLIARGIPVVGLEPSCVLTLRDEFLSMLPGSDTQQLSRQAFLLEEFLAHEAAAGRISRPIGRGAGKVLLHGHCHQKAFGAMGSLTQTLALVEGIEVETVESSCCGMAGAFGYGADTHAASLAMGELSLLPAVRRATPETAVAADGFSCRHQIRDGTGREARHVVRLLHQAIMTRGGSDPTIRSL